MAVVIGIKFIYKLLATVLVLELYSFKHLLVLDSPKKHSTILDNVVETEGKHIKTRIYIYIV